MFRDSQNSLKLLVDNENKERKKKKIPFRITSTMFSYIIYRLGLEFGFVKPSVRYKNFKPEQLFYELRRFLIKS